jgi:hypothetical protein
MLQMICSCGTVLGNKQIIYEEEMKKACETIGLDYNTISHVDTNENYRKIRQDIVKKVCKRICCKQAILNYIDIVYLIK